MKIYENGVIREMTAEEIAAMQEASASAEYFVPFLRSWRSLSA